MILALLFVAALITWRSLMLAVEYSFVFSGGSLLGINLSTVALVMD